VGCDHLYGADRRRIPVRDGDGAALVLAVVLALVGVGVYLVFG
jgi:hypothetical protein